HSGSFMRSATLKGLIIHTADEAGTAAGPDYRFGWGLINMQRAATVVKANNTGNQYIEENVLANGGTYTKTIVVTGTGPLSATICWTDPKGTVDNSNTLNNPALKLVNDLDLRIKTGISTYLPWKLNPANPSAAATKGDNILDNVEKVEVPNILPGIYTIEVTHKGTLERGSQAYSLIISDNSASAAPAIDFASTGLAVPYLSNCPAGSQLVSVKIKNTGTTAQSNIPVTTVIKNGAATVKTLTVTYPGTIEAGEEVTYTYSEKFNALANTTYTCTTTVNFSGDLNSANNQRVTTISVDGGSATPANAIANVCDDKAMLKATAPAGGQVFWYASSTATAPIVAGTDTSTTVIPSNLIYYAAINDAVVNGGAANKSLSNSGNYTSLPSAYINFTTYAPLTIESARLYTGHSGTITFTVGKPVDATHYIPVSTVTVPVYATRTVPVAGTAAIDPADAGAVFLLNLAVPAAGDYRLYMSCADGATIFYNNGITTTPYPFISPGVFSLTGNSGDDGNGGNFQRFYLGLYDMGIKLYGCASARIPVQAIVTCEEAKEGITLGPNPSDGEFRIFIHQAVTGDMHLSIANMLGQRVYTNRYAISPSFKFIQPVDVRHLLSGTYLLEMNYDGKRYTRKLVIRNR
ncbi:MAG TPA: T9SS type A sorting domain-containing protein, partial [Chitinophagaceae bacterium]|nr:T9SS type A sorting domain-containing protein [Chitinophagaceae bacterium]